MRRSLVHVDKLLGLWLQLGLSQWGKPGRRWEESQGGSLAPLWAYLFQVACSTSYSLPWLCAISLPMFFCGNMTTASQRLTHFPLWVPYAFSEKFLTGEEVQRAMKQPTTNGILEHTSSFRADLLAFTLQVSRMNWDSLSEMFPLWGIRLPMAGSQGERHQENPLLDRGMALGPGKQRFTAVQFYLQFPVLQNTPSVMFAQCYSLILSDFTRAQTYPRAPEMG